MIQSFGHQITTYKSFQRQLFIYGFNRVNNSGTSSDDEYGAYYHTLFDRANHELCHNMIRERSSRRHTMKKRKDHDSSSTSKSSNTIKQSSISIKKEENNEESIARIEKSSNVTGCGGIIKLESNSAPIKKEEEIEENIMNSKNSSINDGADSDTIQLKQKSILIKQEEDTIQN